MHNSEKITTFREVFNWIMYDWDNLYCLQKGNDYFFVNKLYITKDKLEYKTESYPLEKGLYEKVNQLYELFQEKPREESEDAYNQLVAWIQDRLDSDDPTGSFALDKVPLDERHRLVQTFIKRGYEAFLYMDNKSIMILEKTVKE